MQAELEVRGFASGVPLCIYADGESAMHVHTVVTTADWTVDDVEEEFHRGCSCSYDCCGHISYHAHDTVAVRVPAAVDCNTVKPGDTIIELGEDRRMWLVWVSSHRNV